MDPVTEQCVPCPSSTTAPRRVKASALCVPKEKPSRRTVLPVVCNPHQINVTAWLRNGLGTPYMPQCPIRKH